MVILNCAEWIVGFFIFSLSCLFIVASLIAIDWLTRKWIDFIWGSE